MAIRRYVSLVIENKSIMATVPYVRNSKHVWNIAHKINQWQPVTSKLAACQISPSFFYSVAVRKSDYVFGRVTCDSFVINFLPPHNKTIMIFPNIYTVLWYLPTPPQQHLFRILYFTSCNCNSPYYKAVYHYCWSHTKKKTPCYP